MLEVNDNALIGKFFEYCRTGIKLRKYWFFSRTIMAMIGKLPFTWMDLILLILTDTERLKGPTDKNRALLFDETINLDTLSFKIVGWAIFGNSVLWV